MQCSKCKRKAIHYQAYSGQNLCEGHLVADVERKAKRTIRQQRSLQPGDSIAVLQRGEAADKALLSFLQKLTNTRRDIQIQEFPAMRVRDLVTSGDTGVTRIALAATLEETSTAILTSILQGNPVACLYGSHNENFPLPIVTPFCQIPADEIALYTQIQKLGVSRPPHCADDSTLYAEVGSLLTDYTSRHPAAPHAILNLCEALGVSGKGGAESGTRTGTEQLKKKRQ